MKPNVRLKVTFVNTSTRAVNVPLAGPATELIVAAQKDEDVAYTALALLARPNDHCLGVVNERIMVPAHSNVRLCFVSEVPDKRFMQDGVSGSFERNRFSQLDIGQFAVFASHLALGQDLVGNRTPGPLVLSLPFFSPMKLSVSGVEVVGPGFGQVSLNSPFWTNFYFKNLDGSDLGYRRYASPPQLRFTAGMFCPRATPQNAADACPGIFVPQVRPSSGAIALQLNYGLGTHRRAQIKWVRTFIDVAYGCNQTGCDGERLVPIAHSSLQPQFCDALNSVMLDPKSNFLKSGNGVIPSGSVVERSSHLKRLCVIFKSPPGSEIYNSQWEYLYRWKQMVKNHRNVWTAWQGNFANNYISPPGKS